MLLSPRREVGEFRKRYKWMALAATLYFSTLMLRLMFLQIGDYDHWNGIAEANITKYVPLAASRGIIRDARGRIISTNTPSYAVYITPAMFDEAQRSRFVSLMRLPPEEAEALFARVDEVPERRRMHQIPMIRSITRDQLAAIETHQGELSAVDVAPRPQRTYPYGRLGAHAIGYLNEVTAEDLERLGEDSGYRAGDVIGRMGVERAAESDLRGTRGHRIARVDARGRRPDRIAGLKEEVVDPQPGHDLVLSLDMELMQAIDRHFTHPSGAVVVVEVQTGRVRALYSKPSYDLNDFTQGMSHEDYQSLLEDPFRPLIDKSIFESYFPGSIFKPFSALAGLASGVDPNERYECIGYYMIGTDRKGCTSAHGEVDMRTAITQSCNVYFYHLAEQVGLEAINSEARLFGLGTRTGIHINSEAPGMLPSRGWYEEHFGRFRVGDTLNVAIGQGNTRATLIQMALAYAALANGGTLYEPLLIESIRNAAGEEIQDFPPRVVRHLDMPEEHIALVQAGLFGVVNQLGGTAYESRIPGGVMISGKTGTAEVAPGIRRRDDPRRAVRTNRPHAWFAGYAPADDPEVAIIVLVEHGGSGGRAAAPIGTRVLEDYLGGRP